MAGPVAHTRCIPNSDIDAADHVMGIVPILRSVLYPPRTEVTPQAPPRLEIYGPAGLRTFVRSVLKMTLTRTSDRYVVHELLAPDDEATPCDPPEVMHSSENAGRDIRADANGFWKDIATTTTSRLRSKVVVDAGRIDHRGETSLATYFNSP
jgi:ribonuclease Z